MSTSDSTRKRQRLTVLTPAGLLRQRKRRGGGTGLSVAARRLGNSIRSGSTPSLTSMTYTGADQLPPPASTRRASESEQPPTPQVESQEYSDDEEDELPDDHMITTLVKQTQEEVKELWDQMSDEQRQRYGVYRRTALNKGAVKRLVSHILNQQVSGTLTFVIAGFSKVFVGEIVERAVEIQRRKGQVGPLRPEDLREAYRLYKREHKPTQF